MALAQVNNQLLRSQGNDTTTVATNYPITGDGSTQLPLGLAEDYRGADGTSVTFEISAIEDGHRVTLSGAQGQESFDVLNGTNGTDGQDGAPGDDGQSVTFDITNITNGHQVTLSGVQGSSSFDVMNGENGVDGVSPTFRFEDTEDGVTVYVSGAQGESSFNLYNALSGSAYSAGDNIDVTDFVISGRNWLPEIESAISSVSGDYYPMTGNPSEFLVAGDLSSYYQKNETSSKEEISAAFDAIPEITAYSAGANIDITDYVVSGKDWTDTITAASAYAASQAQGTEYSAGDNIDITNHIVSGKDWTSTIESAIAEIPAAIDYSAGANIDITNHVVSGKDWTDTITAASAYAASQAQGAEYSAGANIDITNHVVSGKDWSDTITAASSYAYNEATANDHTYTGVAPIVVNNNEDKISANCIELSAGSGIDSIKLATGVIEVSGGVGGSYQLSYFTPSTGFTSNSGLEIRKYVGNMGTTRRVLSGTSTLGELVPEVYNSRQYLATNAAGNMVWDDISNISPIVLVATSGDIPASGTTDGKLYVVTGT